MLTSIATIAGAVTALIGGIWAIVAAVKKRNEKKWVDEGRSLEQQIAEAKSNEERAKLVGLLASHRAK